MEAFSFLKSIINIPFNFFKDFVPDKKSKEKSGFMDNEFMEKYNELSAGQENYYEKYRLRTGPASLPNTQVNLASGGSSFNFKNPQLQTKLRKLINNTNNREILEAMKRANYTPQAVRPMQPNVKPTSTKYG